MSTIAGTENGAWTRDTLSRNQWLVPLPAECWNELETAVHETAGRQTPVHELSAEHFSLTQCRVFASNLRRQYLDAGPKFAVVDRLPVERFSKDELTRAYWLLASLVSRPVQQTYGGTMLFHVRDEGVGSQMKPGSGIRATITNLDLNFHNDNCFNTVMPDYVGLLCLRAARTGGLSKAVSFHTLHELLAQENPDLLERLYEPIWWDRHREFGPDELPYVANPVFEDDEQGRPLARYSTYNIRGGYKLREEALDDRLELAMAKLAELFSQADLQSNFMMEPGQIQFVNNRSIGHARTDFVDDAVDPDHKRHLVRLWLRDRGSVQYEGTA
ncbi:TauD/TfdA family dioxygenase [Ottowia thiooxydans]|uniref:TauD/TfdA family dioxygenase n=1 Tax=Ottowia thiooxydans TaxID=219182 RepID=UPI00040829BA|nr:TauD/TfdA family dioxygenase [Ottowia thiooxydans]